MKIVVGVDANETYKPILSLIAHLGFSNASITLLNVVNPVMAFVPPEASDAELQADYLKVSEAAGHRSLDHAMDEACGHNIPTKKKLVFGMAGDRLIDEAASENADLVAVTATHHGGWSSSLLGSISRALAIGCPSCLLVAKGEFLKAKPLRIVFATDHSPFSARCLERFIALQAKGVEEVHVVSAYSVSDQEAEVLGRNLPSLGGDVERWICSQIESENEKVCEKLRAAGYVATSSAVSGSATKAIHEAMESTKASLLVVGSHGKGFIARTFIGSVSLHEVVAESYPVLVIRP